MLLVLKHVPMQLGIAQDFIARLVTKIHLPHVIWEWLPDHEVDAVILKLEMVRSVGF